MNKHVRSFLDDIFWYLMAFIPVVLIIVFGMIAVTY